MESIHRFTRKALTAEEVYTFPLVLCDNEIDRDMERFTVDALADLATLFIGKTGLFDHSMESRDQTARIFKAECVTDPERTTSVGEPYTFIRAVAYMPRTEKNQSLIEEIDSGIKKEVSVGCAVAEVYCSICGADVRHAPCAHRKGEVYDGVPCHHILDVPTDAYEWSFVAVPAQRSAGVTKTFRMESDGASGSEVAALRKQIAALEEEAKLGKAYRASLLSETIRLGLSALPQMDGKVLQSACEKLSAEELQAFSKCFAAQAHQQTPVHLQLFSGDPHSDTNNAFKI